MIGRYRGPCRACGSPLTFGHDGATDLWLTLGSLDYPEAWPMTPQAAWGTSAHAQTATRIPWYAVEDGLPRLAVAIHRLAAEAALKST